MGGFVTGTHMTPQTLKALDHRLQPFLENLLEPMGRSERRHGARVYVHGLLSLVSDRVRRLLIDT